MRNTSTIQRLFQCDYVIVFVDALEIVNHEVVNETIRQTIKQ